MAEKGILVADATSGESVACRDAFEQDDGSNNRVIQRVDFASGRVASPIGAPNRGSSGNIDTADSVDLTSLPTDLTDNLIDVGDKSTLVVFVEHTDSSGSVDITPLIYDNEAPKNIIGMLPTQTSVVSVLQRGTGLYISSALTWDISGAHNIGIHINNLSAGNEVVVYADVI